MKKIPDEVHFYKVYKHLLPLGALEAIVYGFVEQFEATGNECFASREYIAEHLHTSPSSVGRAINRLIKAGYIERFFNGKNRHLRTKMHDAESWSF